MLFLSVQPPAAGPGAPMMQPMMAQPMMGQPMMRPPFTGMAGAAPGAPVTHQTYYWYTFVFKYVLAGAYVFIFVSQLSPGPATQSPKKPKDPLAELDLKDFL